MSKKNYKNIERWTQTAIDCYLSGCNCSECEIYKNMECQCKMKDVVFELVKKLGAPLNVITNNIMED